MSLRQLTRVALLLGIAQPVHAREGLDAKLFDPVPSPYGILSTHGARMLGHLELFGGASFDYANDLLRAERRGETVFRPIHHRLTSELGLAIGLCGSLDLGISLPLYLRQTAEGFPTADGAGETGLGDLRLLPKLAILRHRGGAGLGLALVGEISLPTGDEDRLMGDPGVTFTPRLVLDYVFQNGLLVALNAGYRVRRKAQFGDLPLGDEVRAAVGIEVPLRVLDLSVGLEVNLARGLGEDEGSTLAEQRKSPVEALGLLRWRSRSGLVLSLASGVGLTSGYGAPDVRAVLGLGYHLAWQRHAPPPATAAPLAVGPDGRRGRRSEPAPRPTPSELAAAAAVSLADHPARFDLFAASDPDPDGDGLSAPLDRCPDRAEDLDRFEDLDGCPDPDNDRDGIPDAVDGCPFQAETVNGLSDDDGCPDAGASRVSIVDGKLAIKEKVHFASGSDVLEPASNVVLQQVAGFLRAQWTIRLVRIEGHTDDLGDKEMNVDLSERRARRVMSVLGSHGVAAHRLEARGYGPTVPIASNRSREGRSANRRVELTIVTAVRPQSGGQP